MLKLLAASLALSAAFCAQAQVNPLQGTWTTTLQARDLNADGVADAYYDTDLDITWLADANYAGTTGVPTLSHVAGFMNFTEVSDWISGLDVAGVTGWRLPTASFTEGAQCPLFQITELVGCHGYTPDASNNEMAHLFEVTLGNTTGSLTNVGPMLNLASGSLNDRYWTGSTYLGPTHSIPSALYFNFTNGLGDADPQLITAYAWAVHDGDLAVAPVPNPPASVLMLAGLAALGWVVGRRR
jgi:hypothetical protein